MAANSVMSVWIYALPVCSGTISQKYRYLFVQGQWNTLATSGSAGNMLTALNTELNRLPSELNLGTITTNIAEFVCIGRIIIKYTGGNWSLAGVYNLTGNKFSQIGSPSGNFLSAVQTSASLTGNGTTGNILDINSTIYNNKTFDGYNKFGSDAPAIKIKKLTGTTAGAENQDVSINHGVNYEKIISINVLVLADNQLLHFGYPPIHTPGYEYHYIVDSTSIIIRNHPTNSELILSKPFIITIMYEE